MLFLLVATACSVTVPNAQPAAVEGRSGAHALDVVGERQLQEELREAAEAPEAAPTALATVVSAQPSLTPAAVAELGNKLPSAPIGFAALDVGDDGPRPVGLTIESIGVDEAVVIPVGINADDASMEIPPADEVGWYRFGSRPGDNGSAVLAAHIAYDGRDGVFRRLAELKPGSVVVVEFDDASTQRWSIDTVTDYNKTKLPDELFAVDGEPRLALITCGGYFNPGLRSYDSNTVAVARQL